MRSTGLAMTILLLLFQVEFSQAQEFVLGKVVSATTNEPLSDVSVFYDGTTLGTTTDGEGRFEIRFVEGLSAPLIISFIGFESIEVKEKKSRDLGVLELKPKTVALNEVVLEEDIWDRKKKMAIFKKEFLGTTRAGNKSTILNPEDVVLRFSKSEKRLYAFADKPLKIENPVLGYSVISFLESFETNFTNIKRKNPVVASTLFSCRTLFKENEGDYERNRQKSYRGSVLHFMRALTRKELDGEGFKIYLKRFQIDPYTQLKVRHLKFYYEVIPLQKQLYVRFSDRKNSLIRFETTLFFVDEFGNHKPPKSVLFGGEMGEKRMADLLPLDYSFPN